ncbi:hypothetical protein GFL38_10620 [Rhizobium leguminosarum bv. viciae]|uniref:hypothetical protein n=1 Tax=Rhizobium ruizarguesonis TaxID=2081791 RepID=UPI00143F06BF|nr:hypothetical protein [Rhizobium ruizarguesonis]NKJ72716.1 hypothetical protein [Rhizobium leguminosarum bv. viciae]NKQ80395.1 hypothetical protein [Rhizobium ruizarguesonis]
MAKAGSITTSGLLSLKDPVRKFVVSVILALALALFIARAPTVYTGKIPLIGDYVPLNLNAVYLNIFGQILAVTAALYIWARLRGRPRFRGSYPAFFRLTFLLYILLLAFLALQFFIVLAPEGQCDRLPNFDCLWANDFGDVRIVHCMSGTEEINKQMPFYLRQQILQSWAMALCPLVAPGLLLHAWIHVRQNQS